MAGLPDLIGGSNVSTTQGSRSTSAIATARKTPQFTGETIRVNANTTPLLLLQKKIGKNIKVKGATFFHLLRDMIPRNVSLIGSVAATPAQVAAGDLTFAFATGQGAYVYAGNTLQSERTGEEMLITSVTGDVATVTRAFGGGAGGGPAAAILAVGAVAEELRIMGSAFDEGSAAPSGLSVEPTILQNACQCFRGSVEATGRDIATEVYGDEEWMRLHQDAVERMNVDKESAYIFSQGKVLTGTQTKTMGLLGWIASNVFLQGGSLDETSLENYTEAWYRRNFGQSADMYTLCGVNPLKAMDAFARDSLRLRSEDETLGLKIATWRCSFGDHKLIAHGLFTPGGSSLTAAQRGSQGYMIGVNGKMLGEVEFATRGLRLEKDVQLPGVDGKKDCWTWDGGIRVLSEKAHFFASGITGP